MANKLNVTTTIKMPVYLQYYIKFRFFKGGNSCDGVNYFSRFISKSLSVRPKDLENRLDKTEEDFTFILPHLDNKNPVYYNYISEENNELIITAMEYIYYETLFMYMDSTCKYDLLADNKIKIRYGERKKTIKYFCIHSGIPCWAINIETINRLYSRHIAKYKNQIINYKQLDIDF